MNIPVLSELRVAWRLARGFRLRPWQSPYLRWRIETYSGLHAERIGFRDFWTFGWNQRRELWRYLGWAARMNNTSFQTAAVRDQPDLGD